MRNRSLLVAGRGFLIAGFALTCALVLALGAAGANLVWTTQLVSGGSATLPSTLVGASVDGSRVFFETADRLLPSQDHDSAVDVYERDGATLSLVSGGTANVDARFDGTSVDGSQVFFRTSEPLLPDEDTDLTDDIYRRAGASLALVSRGSENLAATFGGASADGTRAFFTTQENLIGESDDDGGIQDVYEWNRGVISLVSRGPGQNAAPAFFQAVSADGSRVFFRTSGQLVSSVDQDTAVDFYVRGNGVTSLVSGGTANVTAFFLRISADGTRAFFHTGEKLLPADLDNAVDVYGTDATTLSLVSGGSGANDAFLDHASADGTRLVFSTLERLLPELDVDNAQDLYRREGPTLTLLSGGTANLGAFYAGASADGRRIVFKTAEALLPLVDTNARFDVYEVSDGVLSLVAGASVAGSLFAGVAADGTSVFLASGDDLLPDEDHDLLFDFYLRREGALHLVAAGAVDPTGFLPVPRVSSDGRRLLFNTSQRLLPDEDPDAVGDAYVVALSEICVPDARTACLGGGRFEARVDWQQAASSGDGQVMTFGDQRAQNDDSAFYWFFAPTNFEMGLKVLNACGVNRRFWVFISGLTDQGWGITIRDTQTGATKTYANSLNHLTNTTADTAAFDCSVADGLESELESAAGPVLASAMAVVAPRESLANRAGLTSCTPDPTTSCLASGRFRVTVDWQSNAGAGAGHVMNFGGLRAENDDSAFYWFFSPTNFEIGLKVLNACGVNDKFWVFISGLTNQGWTVEVVDTATGAIKTYRNELDHLTSTTADTAAFDCE